MQAPQLWQAVLSELRRTLPANHFRYYIATAEIVSLEDNVATIAATSPVNRKTLETRFGKQVEQTLSDFAGHPVSARFVVMNAQVEAEIRSRGTDGSEPALAEDTDGSDDATRPTQRTVSRGPAPRRTGGRSRQPDRPLPTEADLPREADRRPQRTQAVLSAAPTHGLNPRYTYDTYVVGGSNRFAHAASLSVADRPGARDGYNPFYVYGGVGLGKTHLIQSIGHKALEANPDLVIRYVSSERFTNDLINNVRNRSGDMEVFRASYRRVDILMIDDIQFIAGKEATMEEFFHTFNALRESGKQVIITSDKPPKSIQGLEERLRSRFEGGLMADVQAPDYEMRMAILRTKSEELGLRLPNDVAEYIAGKDQSNTRELEGALNKILALAELTNRPLSLDLAMESLTDVTMASRKPKLNPGAILETVAGHYGVSLDAIKGKTRTKDIVVPRQVAMFLIRNETSASLVEIGQLLGGRDHTTVMHGITKVQNEQGSDSNLRSNLLSLRERLYTSHR